MTQKPGSLRGPTGPEAGRVESWPQGSGDNKIETKAKDGDQTPQEFAEPSSLVLEFIRCQWLQTQALKEPSKLLIWPGRSPTSYHPQSFIQSIGSAFPGSLISLS